MKEKMMLKEKSIRFAVRIVNLYKYLCEDKKEFVISKQLLRSILLLTTNYLPLTVNH